MRRGSWEDDVGVVLGLERLSQALNEYVLDIYLSFKNQTDRATSSTVAPLVPHSRTLSIVNVNRGSQSRRFGEGFEKTIREKIREEGICDSQGIVSNRRCSSGAPTTRIAIPCTRFPCQQPSSAGA